MPSEYIITKRSHFALNPSADIHKSCGEGRDPGILFYSLAKLLLHPADSLEGVFPNRDLCPGIFRVGILDLSVSLVAP